MRVAILIVTALASVAVQKAWRAALHHPERFVPLVAEARRELAAAQPSKELGFWLNAANILSASGGRGLVAGEDVSAEEAAARATAIDQQASAGLAPPSAARVWHGADGAVRAELHRRHR